MTKGRRMTALAALAALLAITGSWMLAPGHASAHERRTVAGKYTFVVGFLNEPAYVEDANGVSLTVTNAQSNQPVNGLEKTLKVEVTTGGASKTMDLATVFNKDGAYKAEFIPTKAGSYSFRFFGSVEDAQVNEKFDSGPGRFDDVKSKASVEFPTAVPSNGELAQQIQQVQQGSRPAEAAAQPAASATTGTADAQRAIDRANTARNLAISFGVAGIVIGALGLATGLYALRSRSAGGRPATGGGTGGGPTEPV